MTAIRIKLTPEEATSMLNGLPGGPQIYREATKAFLGHCADVGVVVCPDIVRRLSTGSGS